MTLSRIVLVYMVFVSASAAMARAADILWTEQEIADRKARAARLSPATKAEVDRVNREEIINRKYDKLENVLPGIRIRTPMLAATDKDTYEKYEAARQSELAPINAERKAKHAFEEAQTKSIYTRLEIEDYRKKHDGNSPPTETPAAAAAPASPDSASQKPAEPVSPPKRKLTQYSLADGSSVLAVSAIDTGDEVTIKDESGKTRVIKKSDIVEVKKGNQ